MDSPDAPLAVLKGIDKVFCTDEIETHALSDIHLEIGQGEFLMISGPSGCGKSTLLSIVGLLDVPTSGHYSINNRDPGRLSATARARLRNEYIGFIFQSFNLISNLTVRENVALPLTYRSLSRREREARVREVLDRVCMSHRMNHYPSQLSGGQQQRVAVARAIAGGPQLLLADEPTGNLDSHNSQVVMDLIEDLHRNGTTVCMVSHDPRYSQRSQRTVYMMDGKVIEDTRHAGQRAKAESPVRI